jgi:hypothetical protein
VLRVRAAVAQHAGAAICEGAGPFAQG